MVSPRRLRHLAAPRLPRLLHLPGPEKLLRHLRGRLIQRALTTVQLLQPVPTTNREPHQLPRLVLLRRHHAPHRLRALHRRLVQDPTMRRAIIILRHLPEPMRRPAVAIRLLRPVAATTVVPAVHQGGLRLQPVAQVVLPERAVINF